MLNGSVAGGPSDYIRPREPHPDDFFDIVEGFTDADGDTVLLVKEATADAEAAVAVEEMFDAFGDVYVFVLPDTAIVERTTRARVAERAGVNLGALAEAKREYHLLLNNPGEGHLSGLGAALERVWD